MPKISVVVPVYNAEKYVSKCIDSILEQTFADLELILIDDGSTDNSGLICDEYAAKDNRIIVFHVENSGVSSARNIGLSTASGEWLMFVDADDWLNVNTISGCLPFCENYDIIRFNTLFISDEKKNGEKLYDLNNMTKEEYISKIISIDTMLGVWGGLFRRGLFVDNGIRFDTSLTSGEDWVVLFTCVLYARRIKFINDAYYNYLRLNESSATFGFHYNAALSAVMAQKKIASLLNDQPISIQYRNALSSGKCKIAYGFVANCILNPSAISKKEFAEFNENMHLSIEEILYANIGAKMKSLLLVYLLRIFRHLLSSRLTEGD